jgi:hypothetical protein
MPNAGTSSTNFVKLIKTVRVGLELTFVKSAKATVDNSDMLAVRRVGSLFPSSASDQTNRPIDRWFIEKSASYF